MNINIYEKYIQIVHIADLKQYKKLYPLSKSSQMECNQTEENILFIEYLYHNHIKKISS